MGQPTAHPQLRFRPLRNPYLRRPTREHPVLGKLEFVNFDGGWWQGISNIEDTRVRLDVQKMSPNITGTELDVAASYLTWITSNSALIRQHIAAEFAAGKVYGDAVRSSTGEIEFQRVGSHSSYESDIALLCPYMVVIWSDLAEIRYHCDLFPEGNLCGFQALYSDLEGLPPSIAPKTGRLHRQEVYRRSQRILEETPLPLDAGEFVNSVAFQFLATAAQWSLKWDAVLIGLLDEAIRDVQSAVASSTGEMRSYLRSVALLLSELKKDGGGARD